MRELVIIEKEEEKEIAFVEDGVVKEHYNELENRKRLEGNIYAGKVVDVLPGMQAAFLNIGEEKNAFLHIRDLLPKKSNVTGNKKEDLEKYKIKDYIKPNQMLMVQVKKDSNEIKGARVSTHIQIPGRFVILLPENDFVTVSQKIEEEEERNRLISIMQKEKASKKIGIIIRTAAQGRKQEEIQEDLQHTMEKLALLQRKFASIRQEAKPIILQKSDTILEKIALDLVDNQLDKIWVNTEVLQRKVRNIIEDLQGKVEVTIECQKEELENKYDIKSQVEKIKNRKVWLKCGGFITIDKTEALTAIDVNSRKIYRKRKFRGNGTKSK